MKFISWNVNGLRACIQKGFLDFFNQTNADFFCLQETKLQEGQLALDLPGYEQYWCYAEKKGYSGTAIFTRHTPLSVRYGMGIAELDTEGRLITLEYPEFYLVTCYTPNAQRELARIGHRMRWEEAFRSYLMQLDSQKPVILCGDLNVAHQEIDLKNPGPNRGSAGFSDQERGAFTELLKSGFTDTFRHLNPTATGCYTWWSYMFNARKNNAGWRIDYFLVSDRLKDAVYATPIHADVLGSDHCPVELQLDTACNGSIWREQPEGIATQVKQAQKPLPVSVKKAIIGGIACLVFALGFGSGFLAKQLLPGKTQEPVQTVPLSGAFFTSSTLISYPIYDGLLYNSGISPEAAKELSTWDLVSAVCSNSILRSLAVSRITVKDGTPFLTGLTSEEFSACVTLIPALAELLTREDAVAVMQTTLKAYGGDTTSKRVLGMLMISNSSPLTVPESEILFG